MESHPNNEFHNDFDQRIGEYNSNISDQKGRYENMYNAALEAGNAYKDSVGNQADYRDMMSEAEQKYGTQAATDQYQNSLKAVAATQQAMNTLPSSVNGSSNVVLSQAQRQAALGNQMNKYQNSLSALQQQNAVDQSAANLALQQASQMSQALYGQQQDNLNRAQQDWLNQHNVANNLYQNMLNNYAQRDNTYSQLYNDEYQHERLALDRYLGDLNAQLQRETNAAQRYAADAGLRVQQYMNQQAQANAKKNTSFAAWLNSDDAFNQSGWAEGMTDADKVANLMNLSNNYNSAIQSGNANTLNQIMSGSTYQNYLNWRRAQ